MANEPPIHLGYFASRFGPELNGVLRKYGFGCCVDRRENRVYFKVLNRACHLEFSFEQGKYHAEFFMGNENVSSFFELRVKIDGVGNLIEDGLEQLAQEFAEHLFKKPGVKRQKKLAKSK